LADFAGLLGVIKQASLDAVKAASPMAVMFGKVSGLKPLQINVEQKMTLEGPQLILSRNVTDHIVEMTVDHFTGSATVSLTMADTVHAHGVPAHSTNPAAPDIKHVHSMPAAQTGQAGEEEPHYHNIPANKSEAVGPDTTHDHQVAVQSTESGGFSTAGSGAGSHTHSYTGRKQFLIHNALVIGDEVILIRLPGGQRFLVIDRLG